MGIAVFVGRQSFGGTRAVVYTGIASEFAACIVAVAGRTALAVAAGRTVSAVAGRTALAVAADAGRVAVAGRTVLAAAAAAAAAAWRTALAVAAGRNALAVAGRTVSAAAAAGRTALAVAGRTALTFSARIGVVAAMLLCCTALAAVLLHPQQHQQLLVGLQGLQGFRMAEKYLPLEVSTQFRWWRGVRSRSACPTPPTTKPSFYVRKVNDRCQVVPVYSGQVVGLRLDLTEGNFSWKYFK